MKEKGNTTNVNLTAVHILKKTTHKRKSTKLTIRMKMFKTRYTSAMLIDLVLENIIFKAITICIMLILDNFASVNFESNSHHEIKLKHLFPQKSRKKSLVKINMFTECLANTFNHNVVPDKDDKNGEKIKK